LARQMANSGRMPAFMIAPAVVDGSSFIELPEAERPPTALDRARARWRSAGIVGSKP
jgi:hypothetical protein